MPFSLLSCDPNWQTEGVGLACSLLMWQLKASLLGGLGPSGVCVASHRQVSCLEIDGEGIFSAADSWRSDMRALWPLEELLLNVPCVLSGLVFISLYFFAEHSLLVTS